MKALGILNHIYSESTKNTAKGFWIEPNIIKEAIDELEKMSLSNHSLDFYRPMAKNKPELVNSIHSTATTTSSKDCCSSLEKRVKHIENTLGEIFRASTHNKDALNKNREVRHYFESKL